MKRGLKLNNTSDKFNKTKLLQGPLIKNSDSQLFGIQKSC